jgi:hypothetical protein
MATQSTRERINICNTVNERVNGLNVKAFHLFLRNYSSNREGKQWAALKCRCQDLFVLEGNTGGYGGPIMNIKPSNNIMLVNLVYFVACKCSM